MDQKFFERQKGVLCCEGLSLEALANEFGTPLYVYSASHLKERFNSLHEALKDYPHINCYAVKANSNLSILKLLAKEGAGFDIVSGGELYRVKTAGAPTSRCVYAGVGKSEAEIKFALENGILYFSIESQPELERINNVATKLGCKAPIAIRVNPNVDAHTHAYITTGKSENKFGLDFETAEKLYKEIGSKYAALEAVAVQMHIGSQITETTPYKMAVEKVATFAKKIIAAGAALKYFDVGGGLGIVYSDEKPATPKEFVEAVLPFIAPLGLTFVSEMGRFVCGNAGVLLAKIEYVKKNPDKTFVITNAAMNDLLRPALYGAHHEISAVAEKAGEDVVCDVVGPVCESGDFFGKDRTLKAPKEGEIICLHSAGAYGFTMSSNYNTRNRPAEVLVENGKAKLIRRRDTWEDQVRQEQEI